jgi:hypothetical protein
MNRRPVFGWISVLLGTAVWLAPAAAFACIYVGYRSQVASSHGVGAVAGGIPSTGFAFVALLIVAGVIAAIVGIVRRERDVWLSIVGLALNAVPLSLLAVLQVMAWRSAFGPPRATLPPARPN